MSTASRRTVQPVATRPGRPGSRVLGRRRWAALVVPAGAAALVLLHPGAALAAAARPTGDDTPLDLGGDTGGDQVGTGSGSIARVLVGLLIVVAVIYGVTWLLRQLRGAGDRTTGGGDGLRQVTTLPLQGGGALTLVRVGDELLLVGSGASGATTLRRYDEDEARALGLWPEHEDDPEGPAGPTGGGSVVAVLGRTLSALRARTVRPDAVVHRSVAEDRTALAPGTLVGPPAPRPAAAPGDRPAGPVAQLVDRLRAMTVRG